MRYCTVELMGRNIGKKPNEESSFIILLNNIMIELIQGRA